MVTQREIAEQLGISQVLVSYALNGNPRVSEDTRQLVQRTARQMGYQPAASRDARALIARRHGKRSKSGLIAVVLPPTTGQPMVQMPFYHEMLTGIEAEAEARGSAVLVCAAGRAQLGEFLAAHQVDGIISLTGNPEIEAAFTAEIPAVVLGVGSQQVAAMVPDNQAGIHLAVDHLWELGHRRIGYMGFPKNFVEGEQRASAYREAFLSHGLEPRPEWVSIETRGFSFTAQEVNRLWDRAPELTALVCYNDTIAMHAVRALEARGLRVPDDVSVTGFDDVTESYLFKPAITSVWFDRGNLGRRAVASLCEGEPAKSGREMVPVRLAIRQSTGPVRAK